MFIDFQRERREGKRERERSTDVVYRTTLNQLNTRPGPWCGFLMTRMVLIEVTGVTPG